MTSTRPLLRLAALLAVLGLVAAACGSDDTDDTATDDTATDDTSSESTDGTTAGSSGDGTSEDGTTEDGDGASAVSGTCETALNEDNSVTSLTELDFSGVTVNVGSKDFVEQFVLGELAIVGLEAGGATVTDSTNLGGTSVNRDALLAGEIDTYFEYNGTGWTVHLANEDPSFERDVLTNDVCVEDYDRNAVRWVGVSPFNDTYGFATASDSPAAGLDLQGMADYITENPDASVCLETEFPNRPDGLVLFEDATGVVIPDNQIEILDTGVIYDETASGNCTFGEVFTTDGRIPALDLDLVEDPGVFILYNVSMTMTDALYQQAPEQFEALADTILGGLDNETMAELNQRVSAGGEDPKAVATDYLTQQGLL
ncbi:MAG: glycine betaine ABC transporter substrate-binding protein [Acidimicrobiales bacterium]